MNSKVFAAAVITLMTAWPVAAQKLRTPDPRPLERPAPLCSIDGKEIRPALQFIIATLQDAKFAINQTNWDAGFALATKADGDAENRIMIWLEWDIAHPGTRFNLFLACGRYETYLGNADLRRVLLSSIEEQSFFGTIRQALVDAAIKKG